MEKALRRHHIRRIKANQKHLGYWYKEATPRQAGIRLHTPCPCSCHMCGNPRRLFGEVTLAELKADLSYDEWLSGY